MSITRSRLARSRRNTISTALFISIALFATSCGDDDADSSQATSAPATDAEPATTTSEAPTTTAAAEAAFPVDVVHALGTTTVPAEPKRVVTVGVTEQDAVLALGIEPVGVTEWYGEQPYATWPWAQDELGDATPVVLRTTDGLDYEAIAALEPDLILGTNAGLDEESYALLTDIAPTIAHPAGAQLYFSPWDEQCLLIGRALGREAEMEQLIADLDAKFAALAAEHPEFAGKKIVFLQNAFYDGEAIAYQNGLSTAFLTDLGFTIPTELDSFESEGGQAYIPLEQLEVLNTADVLLWATESPDDRVALEAEPLYMALEEVRDGHLVFTDGLTAGAIYFTSVLSLSFALDQLVPALASTLADQGPAVIDAT